MSVLFPHRRSAPSSNWISHLPPLDTHTCAPCRIGRFRRAAAHPARESRRQLTSPLVTTKCAILTGPSPGLPGAAPAPIVKQTSARTDPAMIWSDLGLL